MSRWFRIAEEEKKKYQYDFYIRQKLDEGYPYIGMTQDESNDAFKEYVESKASELKSKVPGIESYTLDFNNIWYHAGAVLHIITNDIIQPVYIDRLFKDVRDRTSKGNEFIDWVEVIPGDYNV